jgi:hypothetical protein
MGWAYREGVMTQLSAAATVAAAVVNMTPVDAARGAAALIFLPHALHLTLALLIAPHALLHTNIRTR